MTGRWTQRSLESERAGMSGRCCVIRDPIPMDAGDSHTGTPTDDGACLSANPKATNAAAAHRHTRGSDGMAMLGGGRCGSPNDLHRE